ncbi:MAG: class I tRNA ligase family protein, partial [bacterium]|nr:class I tRNA ligase family protein [bacterium]
AHMHSRVIDIERKKMSKSRGNVIDPIEMVDKYGADALRMSLVFGNAPASDVVVTEEKIKAMRNFSNKIWNMARFIEMKKEDVILKSERLKDPKRKQDGILRFAQNDISIKDLLKMTNNENDKEMIKKTQKLAGEVTKDIEELKFNFASERLYEFIWHEFADKYIEDVKNRLNADSFHVLSFLFLVQLKLLHPFMPFVTEEIYQRLGSGKSLIAEAWPK